MAGSIKSWAFQSGLVALLYLCLANPIVAAVESATTTDLHAIILSPQAGDSAVDHEIRRLQNRIRVASQPNPLIIRLGWAFVAKARLTSDPGFYKLAEECSRMTGEDVDSLQLRGYVAHALHRFSEAETISRRLVSDPTPSWQNQALLGDALMEQGKLVEAVAVYQRMIDIRPCLQTYARVAHVRWLKGDLTGAEELMRVAVESGNSRDPEPAAWAYARLAFYQLQTGKIKAAGWSVDRALEFVKEYPAALFLRSKLEIERGEAASAVESLRRACAQVPLPEYQWALVDSARLAGDVGLAAQTEAALNARGATEDGRSFALFLATRGASPETALGLAQNELANRRDVMTYDAVAWASLASGKIRDASENMKRALAEGTVDARLFYHAARIEAASGQKKSAARWVRRAASIRQMLLPSEQADLSSQAATLGVSLGAESISQTTKPKLADQAILNKQL